LHADAARQGCWFHLSDFLSEDAALLRTECVAMQRTRRRIAGKNSETNLASMLLGWDGKGAARSARKKQPLKN
jgi:hypothetical protein